MAKKEKNNSIKGEYDKIYVKGQNGYGPNAEPYIYISLKDASYGVGEAASQSFSIKEAKEIVGLLEAAIKEANKKKEKN